jgi:hypothetical protein
VFEKVLLAVDGSTYSAKAVPVAADIAKKSNGEVLVFHAREYGGSAGVAGGSRGERSSGAPILHNRTTSRPQSPRCRSIGMGGGPSSHRHSVIRPYRRMAQGRRPWDPGQHSESTSGGGSLCQPPFSHSAGHRLGPATITRHKLRRWHLLRVGGHLQETRRRLVADGDPEAFRELDSRDRLMLGIVAANQRMPSCHTAR